GRDPGPAGADPPEQRAGRLPALRQADPHLAPAARGRDEARPGLQALRRADGGGAVSDEKPKADEKPKVTAEKPARQFRRKPPEAPEAPAIAPAAPGGLRRRYLD